MACPTPHLLHRTAARAKALTHVNTASSITALLATTASRTTRAEPAARSRAEVGVRCPQQATTDARGTMKSATLHGEQL